MGEAPDWLREAWASGSTVGKASTPASPAADAQTLLSRAPSYAGPRPGAPVGPHWGLATQAAQKHGLDPSLLAAVWDFESSGNPGAINRSSGATGLGQVMPREAGPMFRDRPTRQELLDPATNAEWSARILKSGLDRYGSEDKALAAYLGAIDARGNITGAVDAKGTGGNQYIRTVRERQQRYAAAAGPPAVGPGAVPSAAPPALGGHAGAPDWLREAWSAGSTVGRGIAGGASTAPAAGPSARRVPSTTARPPATGPSEPGAAPGSSRAGSSWPRPSCGKPYIWGSAGGRSNFSLDAPGYDCSGFTSYVYKNAFGVNLPAFTGSAYPATKAVAPQEAQPGDLVFWNMGTPDPRRQHVAIYIGDGKVIQSGGQGDGVNIAPVGQMPGAEFRRSPAAYANYSAAPDPARVSTGSPDRPGAVWLQGTVARTPAAAAPAAVPDWLKDAWAAGSRSRKVDDEHGHPRRRGPSAGHRGGARAGGGAA